MGRPAWHRRGLDWAGRWLARGLCSINGRGAKASGARLRDPGQTAPAVTGETGRAIFDQGIKRGRPALSHHGLAPAQSVAGQRLRTEAAEDKVHYRSALQRQCRAADQYGETRGAALGPDIVGRAIRALQAGPRDVSWRRASAVPSAG